MDGRTGELCRKALSAGVLSRSECLEMLGHDETSVESDLIIATADDAVRGRNGNSCSIGVQIGVVTGPCIADCGFCSFAASTTDADDYVMPPRVLRDYLEHVTAYDDVESVSLMTIHNFDPTDLMEAVDTAMETVPGHVSVCVNTGDVTVEEARELKRAGVRRAYHSLRIDEGDDTRLNPMDRFNTIKALISAGIETVTCVEPIGPEHSSEDILRGFLTARDSGCSHCSAGRRVDVPGTRMHGLGEIGLRRLELIRSVLLLSSFRDGFYGGYYGGFDMDYAEYAGSPRDTADYSELNNGNTVEAVRRRLFAKGFTSVRCGDNRLVALDADHLRATKSIL
ncbi:radical SAM protein [Candidatus Methanoprimaticola sp. MG2]|uniref:radical SAM protein n=1 Tax=Candidatus Methanoprimaticola sp. MG2 TaxID=3228838 RepID=UPI0039C68DD2